MSVSAVLTRRFLQFTGISIVLVILSGFIPVFGIMLLFLSIVPQMVLFKEKGYKYAVVSCGFVCMASGWIRGWPFVFSYVFLFSIYSLWYTTMLDKEGVPYRKVVNASLGWMILLILWSGMSYFFLKFNLMEEIIKNAKIAGAVSIGKYYDFGLPQAQIDLIEKSIIKFIVFFKKSFIGWGLLIGMIGSWSVYYTLSKFSSIKPLPAIKKFRLPESYIWILIAAAAFYLVGSKISEYNMLTILGSNLVVVLIAGYLISGFGLVIALMVKWNMAVFMRFFMLFFLFVFLRGLYLLVIVGIVDVWINFRKRWIK